MLLASNVAVLLFALVNETPKFTPSFLAVVNLSAEPKNLVTLPSASANTTHLLFVQSYIPPRPVVPFTVIPILWSSFELVHTVLVVKVFVPAIDSAPVLWTTFLSNATISLLLPILIVVAFSVVVLTVLAVSVFVISAFVAFIVPVLGNIVILLLYIDFLAPEFAGLDTAPANIGKSFSAIELVCITSSSAIACGSFIVEDFELVICPLAFTV